MATLKNAAPTDPVGEKQVNKVVFPPKEFFRRFSNLAHNRILNEDFPHEKLLTVKYKGTGRDFVVNGKGSYTLRTQETTVPMAGQGSLKKVEEKEVLSTSSEVKILTAYSGTSTEVRVSNKGSAKVWTNWGIYDIGKPLELISVFKGTTCFDKFKASLTAYYSDGFFGSATRFQVREKGKNVTIAQKLSYIHQDYWGGLYADVNLTQGKLVHYNTVLGYNVNKNIAIYGEHESIKPKEITAIHAGALPAVTSVPNTNQPAVGDHKTPGGDIPGEKTGIERLGLGKLTLNGVYKDNNIHGLAQLGWEQPSEKVTFEAGVVYTANSTTSGRAKINQDLELSLGGRHKFSKNISLNVGTFAPLQNLDKFYNPNKTVPIPFGASIEFNF